MAQHFDVAVVGMQLSGVITAALLAKRGRRVLLVDHGEHTARYRHKGLSLPLLPALIPSYEQAPQMQRVHDELGLGPELRAGSRALDPAFQAVMPRHRLDIRPGREALLRELRLEFPELSEALDGFFSRLFSLDEQLTTYLGTLQPLPPANLWERWTSRRAVAQMAPFNAPFESDALLTGIPPHHPVRELLLGPLVFFGHLWNDAPSTFHAVRLMARAFRGLHALDSDGEGLPGLLLQAAQRAGVMVRSGCTVRSLRVAGRRLGEMVLEDDRQAHTADFFVANTIGPFSDVLAPEQRHPRFVVQEQSVNLSGALLVLNLVVDKHVVPRGMGQALFLLGGRRQARGEHGIDPPLLLQRLPAPRGEVGSRNAPRELDAAHEVLSIACPVRLAEAEHTPARLTRLKTAMLARLRRLVPFLDDYLKDTSLPIETSQWDTDSEATRYRVDPWRLHPIYEPTQRPLLGVASRPLATYFKNLVHCGRDVMPGLGLEGEYITGLAAAERLQKMAGKRWQGERRSP
jgi:phytoene dehydrogenase-like protein